jgi:hypothetical protein
MNPSTPFTDAAARVLRVANDHNARGRDPHTSHEAGMAVERKGTASDQRTQCLLAVERFPGHTSAELASLTGFDRHMVARRLPELRERELVRNGLQSRSCTVTGNRAMTWYPL